MCSASSVPITSARKYISRAFVIPSETRQTMSRRSRPRSRPCERRAETRGARTRYRMSARHCEAQASASGWTIDRRRSSPSPFREHQRRFFAATKVRRRDLAALLPRPPFRRLVALAHPAAYRRRSRIRAQRPVTTTAPISAIGRGTGDRLSISPPIISLRPIALSLSGRFDVRYSTRSLVRSRQLFLPSFRLQNFPGSPLELFHVANPSECRRYRGEFRRYCGPGRPPSSDIRGHRRQARA